MTKIEKVRRHLQRGFIHHSPTSDSAISIFQTRGWNFKMPPFRLERSRHPDYKGEGKVREISTCKMTDEITDFKLPAYIDNLPFYFEWVIYKGEHCVAQVNLEKSLACHRPIIDIHYCMTKALNGIVEKTVNYVPEHFKPSKLAS